MLRRFLRNIFTRIDPVRVDVSRDRKVVGRRLEALTADFAVEIPYAAFLVYLNDDRIFVVAEQASERRPESFALDIWSV
jgi:hypothetical protein